jgi:hypothetical protein
MPKTDLAELQRLLDAYDAEVAATNGLLAWYKTGSDLSIAAVNAMPALLAELRAAREVCEQAACVMDKYQLEAEDIPGLWIALNKYTEVTQ